jgi:hypothetical protein
MSAVAAVPYTFNSYASPYLPGGKDTAPIMHYLALLLSTDWFLPFWSEIGVDADTATKAKMQEGCREIVRTVMVKKSLDEEGQFDYIDWMQECKLKVRSMVEKLIGMLHTEAAAHAAIEDWTRRDHEGLSAAVMLSLLTRELIERIGGDFGPPPDFSIRVAVMEATVTYELDPNQFEEISKKSASSWDKYVESLLGLDKMPTALSDNLHPAVQVHRLRVLWNRVSERLTVTQRQELLSWCRAMAKSRGFPFDSVPRFISGIPSSC